ncbi:hypothetical protein [Granulicoccus sp. GXG6511]|uniref:hypothetical protein n=1 Tax=Granulicoccus sp. GXG6511 TaxID=3381351 RepID=UPI003D7EB2A7
MKTTRELWVDAWGTLDLRIREGGLTNAETGGPNAAAAKHLFPTVFGGDLAAAHYASRSVTSTSAVVDETLSGTLLLQAVKAKEAELLRLTLLLARLDRIRKANAAGRPPEENPKDLLMPVAREAFESTASRPTDSELRSRLLAVWPHVDDGWEHWRVHKVKVANWALARAEIAAEMQQQIDRAWANRPISPSTPELSTPIVEVLNRWREKKSAPGLSLHWAALTEALTDTNTDVWAQAMHVTGTPTPKPHVVHTVSPYLLDCSLKNRLAGGFKTQGGTLPPLGQLLREAAGRTTLPLGLAQPEARATFALGAMAVQMLPVSSQPAQVRQALQRDRDQFGGTGTDLLSVMIETLDRKGLLRDHVGGGEAPLDEDRTDQQPGATARPNNRARRQRRANRFPPRLALLAGYPEVSGALQDPWIGPPTRLWPRLLGREVRGLPITDIDDAIELIRSAFLSWVNDTLSGRLEGRSRRRKPTAPDDRLMSDDVLALISAWPDADRARIREAIAWADPNGELPDAEPFKKLWEKLVPSKEPGAIPWQHALINLLNHRRGRS